MQFEIFLDSSSILQNIYFSTQLMSDSDRHSIKLEQQDCQDNDNEMENQQHALRSENQAAEDNDNVDGQFQGDQVNQNNLGSQPPLNKKRTHRKLQISNFIMKTYKILEDKRNSSIVEWTDQGNCFIVKDKQKFSRQVLPKYFKHSKFSSFVRQLNMYDFHKIRKQKQIPIFKHRYFKMGCMDLLHKIKRKSGEQGKDQDQMSKQQMNISEQAISSFAGIQHISSKQNIHLKSGISKQQSSQLTIHGQIEMLKKQNNDIRLSVGQLNQQLNFLELNREKRKEKLVKMITSLIFFDLDNVQNQAGKEHVSLRKLQQHLTNEEQPMSFSEYRSKLSEIYSCLKNSLI